MEPAPSTAAGRPRYRARARYRDPDGVTRCVVRHGQTKTAAANLLRAALAERQHTTSAGITAATLLADLADHWTARTAPDWATGTADTYAQMIAKHVKPRVGAVRVGEVRQSTVHRVLAEIRDDAGPSAAKTAKTILSGMFGLAMREDAMTGNPALQSIRLPTPRKPPAALTPDQADQLVDQLRGDQRAVNLDLPDLAEWMLGTGARIGETLAARRPVIVDGTWEINATVVRVRGQGLVVQERPKTAAGWRRLALPPFVLAMLERRDLEPRFEWPHAVVFGSPYRASLRDRSNTTGDLRDVLDRLGWGWVTSHTFRKTVATRLDEAGLPARVIADQLGHSRPSMTQDVYLGRGVVSAAAAKVLDR